MKLNLKELLGDNYHDGMTADELLTAAEDIDLPDSDNEGLRKRLDEVNSESANRKKQLRKQDTTIAELTETVTRLQRENTINKRTSVFASMGYGEKEAVAAATAAAALNDEDFESLVGTHRTFITDRDQQLEAARQRRMGDPASGKPGEGGNGFSREGRKTLSLAERQELFKKDPEAYKSAK